MLQRFFSRCRRSRPRVFSRLPNRRSRFATLARRVVGKLGSPFRARRIDFLLLLSTGADVILFPLTIRLPLLLTFTSTRLPLLGLFWRPVGHRVHLSSGLEDNKQDKSQSTDFKQTEWRKQNHSRKCRIGPCLLCMIGRVERSSWLLGGCLCSL